MRNFISPCEILWLHEWRPYAVIHSSCHVVARNLSNGMICTGSGNTLTFTQLCLTPHQAEVFKCNAFVLVQGAVYMQYMYHSNLRYLGVLRVSTPTRVPGLKLQLAPRKDAGTYCSSARTAETGRQCTRCQRLQATHHVLSPNSLMHQRLHQHVCTHGIGT